MECRHFLVFQEQLGVPTKVRSAAGPELWAQSPELESEEETQGLRSKSGTKTWIGPPKVTSSTGSREQAKNQNLQVLCCCIFIFPGFVFLDLLSK